MTPDYFYKGFNPKSVTKSKVVKADIKELPSLCWINLYHSLEDWQIKAIKQFAHSLQTAQERAENKVNR